MYKPPWESWCWRTKLWKTNVLKWQLWNYCYTTLLVHLFYELSSVLIYVLYWHHNWSVCKSFPSSSWQLRPLISNPRFVHLFPICLSLLMNFPLTHFPFRLNCDRGHKDKLWLCALLNHRLQCFQKFPQLWQWSQNSIFNYDLGS